MGSRLKPEHHTPLPTQGACNLQIIPGVFPTGVITDRLLLLGNRSVIDICCPRGLLIALSQTFILLALER